MGDPVAFFEIISPDAARARSFYTELFGWAADANPAFGGYALVDTKAGDDAIGGGIGEADEPGEAASRSTCASRTWRRAWSGPRSSAARWRSRRTTCPATPAGPPSSPTRTGTRSGSGSEP